MKTNLLNLVGSVSTLGEGGIMKTTDRELEVQIRLERSNGRFAYRGGMVRKWPDTKGSIIPWETSVLLAALPYVGDIYEGNGLIDIDAELGDELIIENCFRADHEWCDFILHFSLRRYEGLRKPVDCVFTDSMQHYNKNAWAWYPQNELARSATEGHDRFEREMCHRKRMAEISKE